MRTLAESGDADALTLLTPSKFIHTTRLADQRILILEAAAHASKVILRLRVLALRRRGERALADS